MTRRSGWLGALGLAVLLLSGHIGNSTVFLEGNAGPYPVRVVVRPPDVIPGQAEISVRALGPGVERVSVRPVRWDLGLEGAPRADVAVPVRGEPGLWSAQLWLMEFGSYSVHVGVEGERGEGTIIVPVAAVSTAIRTMPLELAVPLVGLGLLLVVGVLTLVGAAVREAVLPPGEQPDRARVRRSWIARAVTLPVLALALFGGSRWWDAEDSDYGGNVYRAPEITTTVEERDDRVLTLTVNDWAAPWGSRWSPLIPDHGKLMHMFLVRQPELDAFAHVHPVRLDSATFELLLPPLPAGEYRLYADIVHESGFLQTLTDTVLVPERRGTAQRPADSDDSWSMARPSTASSFALQDGSRMLWERDRAPLRARQETTLRFRVADPAGAPASLEPYMGMLAHAAVTRDDGSVFVHLHPSGTVSMTAQLRFDQIARGDTIRGADGQLVVEPHPSSDHSGHGGHHAALDVVEFPFEFPQPGRYVIWVQVKRDGQVLTGVFETDVLPS
jgi:hypothetical protein